MFSCRQRNICPSCDAKRQESQPEPIVQDVHVRVPQPGHEVLAVWRWKKSSIKVYVLRDENYEEVDRSVVFPDPNLGQLISYLDYPAAMQAVRAFRETLRAE